MAALLITGGAGFIGSHLCVLLLQLGHRLVVLDDFSNSSPEALRRVEELAGAPLRLIEGDIRDPAALEQAFAGDAPIDAVIHLAGCKAVGESVADPLRYWDVNVGGSVRLLAAMRQAGCRTIVFSSSATLYGFTAVVPIPESAPVAPVNPYGETKAAVERLLADVAASEPGWRVALLRYFNPCGAHPSGRIGEDPGGLPNNLFPFVSQVAIGRRPFLRVFGGDWPTADGTGVRDYIHVMDLADGHRAALEVLLAEAPQRLTLNLGSGAGHSVLEVVRAYERASGRPIAYRIEDRRPGDVAVSVADPALAAERLGWRTERGLDAICRDGWAWQSANPAGYGPF
ncbi:UDP-glucose 4-epimerase GalE [Synechococcus sp. ATX 2A4]|uniref:UDP-glucose 4-epimerase GalE n=1 Tax=Synechococcus sp. ATX 2A4 TaxID=2823727 RepID=UPI0020CFAD94|nr:UDP-glucose 4-epimerase GalE [Synechococcus sp. ATX 2A4]MCP9885934.1 UDP-glucose 4-epimerase GalE [Synechococcus sp. ATX 2A4]